MRFQFWEKIDLDNILILQNRSIRFVGWVTKWVTKWLSARFYRSTRVSRCIRWYPDALDEIRWLVCLFDTILSVEKLFFLFLFFFSKLGLDLVRSGLRFLRAYVRPRIIFYRFFFFYHFHFRIDRFFFFKQITLTDDRSSCTFEMTTNNSFQATITPNNIFFFFLSKASLCTDYAKRRERKREREREREKEKKTEKKNTTTTEFVRSRVRVFRSTKNVPILAWPSFPRWFKAIYIDHSLSRIIFI